MILLDKVAEHPSKHHPAPPPAAGDLERGGAPARAPSPTISFGSTSTYVTLPEYSASQARLVVDPADVPRPFARRKGGGGCFCWPEQRDGRFWRAVGLAFAIYVALTIMVVVPVYFWKKEHDSHGDRGGGIYQITVTALVYPSSEGASGPVTILFDGTATYTTTSVAGEGITTDYVTIPSVSAGTDAPSPHTTTSTNSPFTTATTTITATPVATLTGASAAASPAEATSGPVSSVITIATFARRAPQHADPVARPR